MASQTVSSFESTEKATPDTLLRRLKGRWFKRIAEVLSLRNLWLQVAVHVKHPDNENDLIYSAFNIRQLLDDVIPGRPSAEGFLNHWKTVGKARQPTIQDLLNILIENKFYRSADSISQAVLGVPIPSTLYCDTNGEDLLDSYSEKSEDEEKPFVADPERNCEKKIVVDLQNYEYLLLAEVTGNFCDVPVEENGFKLGEGGFGIVYRAFVNDQWIAIKRLKEAIDSQFFNELELLCLYKHENLVQLIGYSNDGPYCCLIYEYVPNGSLMERLACMDRRLPIAWENRFQIALDIVKGLHHLHTFRSTALIHRDIKSANILLGDNLTAKIADFGFARCTDSESRRTYVTSNICGTSVYMAPEALRGTVSVKMDIFSFGIVILELLTGLPPFDPNREDADLLTHMEENCTAEEDIIPMLDVEAGPWNTDLAIGLYNIAKRCIEHSKAIRPTVVEILPDITDVCSRVIVQ